MIETNGLVTEKSDVLKVSDRCDSCGSQAFVWVNGVSGDLYFCGHHFAKFEDGLKKYAFEIIDERSKLVKIPSKNVY